MNRIFQNVVGYVKQYNTSGKNVSTIINSKHKRKYKPYHKKNNKDLENNNKKIKIEGLDNPSPIIEYNKHKKEQIPKRIREMVWTTYNGTVFEDKCYVDWCDNNINVFNFQVGHDIPESKGGTLDINNLKPICGSCNLSMGNKYTITEWSKLVTKD